MTYAAHQVRVYGYVAGDAEKLGYKCIERYGVTQITVHAESSTEAKRQLEEQGFVVLYTTRREFTE